MIIKNKSIITAASKINKVKKSYIENIFSKSINTEFKHEYAKRGIIYVVIIF